MQWLGCCPCIPRVAGLIFSYSSVSDETVNRGPFTMNQLLDTTLGRCLNSRLQAEISSEGSSKCECIGTNKYDYLKCFNVF